MKRILFSLALALSSLLCMGQSQGISYQAIIIDETPQQIPGLNIEGNILVNHPLMVRFTILDAAGTIDYQEEHATSTDAGGMINLTISTGNPTAYSPHIFSEIDWDGTPKYLKVDISTSETETFYVDFSYQLLTFVPYAYHKNITATGTLRVDDKSILQDLTVEKSTNLEGNLAVNNASTTSLTGTLSVTQATDLKGTLNVASASNFKGQVTVDATLADEQENVDNYPLRVKGSNQGIAITVNGSRSNNNNFVVFRDANGVQGRIEGESSDDITHDPSFWFKNGELLINVVVGIKDVVAAATSSTVCVGLGACVTTPTPSLIIVAVAKLIIKIAQIPIYDYFRFENAGVVFKTKGADYAEYLPKATPNESFIPGEIIGVTAGKVTRSTLNADKIMVISNRPIVLGNTPEQGQEHNYVKVAFIGQVDVRVVGLVNVGDFIIPSGRNDGCGIAASPSNITSEQSLQVAGVAWSASQSDSYGIVNVAVGMNSNELAYLVARQDKIIDEQNKKVSALQSQVETMNRILAEFLPGYAERIGLCTEAEQTSSKPVDYPLSNNLTDKLQNLTKQEGDVPYEEFTKYYFDITTEQITEGVIMAEKMLKEQGVNMGGLDLFSLLNKDQNFKGSFVEELQSKIRKAIDEDYNRDIKSGVNAVKLF